MNDDQLLRYSRHILLDEIGIEGQERLLAAHAVVVGAGGLGSPAALYLGAAGVGRITLIDDDEVDLTNLQRQIAHTQSRVGQAKVDSARQAILARNPEVRVDTLRQRADAALLEHRIQFSPQFELEHLASIKALVAAGLGVAALPELAANVGPDTGIVRRRLVAPDLKRPIGLVSLRGRSLSPAASEMVAYLSAEMR